MGGPPRIIRHAELFSTSGQKGLASQYMQKPRVKSLDSDGFFWSGSGTAPDLSTKQFAYDYRGRRISVTDANNRTTACPYDDADRPVAVTDTAQNLTA